MFFLISLRLIDYKVRAKKAANKKKVEIIGYNQK